MIGWLTAIVIAMIAALILWLGPKLAAGRRIEAQYTELAEGLQTLARSLGLENFDRRAIYGDLTHHVDGTFNQLGVDLEVQVGRHHGYARVTVEFPQTLDQDLTILSDRKPAARNWLLRQKETEIGVEDFDRDFILLARHPKRLKAMLTPAIRFQLRRLIDRVDDLEIGDETVFVMARDLTDAEGVSSLLKKVIEVSERIYATAGQLGPSPSKVEATVYEQATSSIYSRESDESVSESSAGATSSAVSTSSGEQAK